LAAALLGDPPVLLFDEPVNGLDPEGILWIRRFMQRLAAEGRTVLVSSHLLSGMAQTADHLIVIGRGKLIADTDTRDFIDRAFEATVYVRSPQLDQLRSLLTSRGMTVREDDGPGRPGVTPLAAATLPATAPQPPALQPALVVVGETSDTIGKLAAENGIT